MDEESEENYIQSPFSCFIQNNDDEELKSINSLSNFIKAHSSDKRDSSSQQSKSKLSNDPDTCDDLSSYIRKSLSSASSISEINSIPRKTDEFDDCNTLEEYTKSFLSSKGSFSIPNRFRTQSENSDCRIKISNLDLVDVNERLTKVDISDSNEVDITDHWNIDLSVALQNSKAMQILPNRGCKLNECNYEPNIYLAHVQLCNLDISSLAREKLPYSASIISSFGYVLSRKWSKLPLPKRLKRIGKNWPYNKSKSFKFNSPSPDDIILKKKAKMRTSSFNDP